MLMYLSLFSSSRLGHSFFKAVTRVQVPQEVDFKDKFK